MTTEVLFDLTVYFTQIALLGGVFVIKKSIEVGDIQSFFQYIRNFTQPIQQIAQVTNLLQSSAAASERVFEFLEEQEESQNEKNPADVNTRSEAAAEDCNRFVTCAICWIGCVKLRIYWKKDWISPTSILFLITNTPPSRAIWVK